MPERTRPVTKRLIVCLLALAIAALACDINPPEWTPSPPQQTAGALNATYQAEATLTAAATPPAP